LEVERKKKGVLLEETKTAQKFTKGLVTGHKNQMARPKQEGYYQLKARVIQEREQSKSRSGGKGCWI